MDLDVNAIDERIYSVFRGLLQDGFRTLKIFLLDVSAQCTGTDSEGRRQVRYVYRLNNIGAKTLSCGKSKTLFKKFRGTLERSGLTLKIL
jgi:hypothetical protein